MNRRRYPRPADLEAHMAARALAAETQRLAREDPSLLSAEDHALLERIAGGSTDYAAEQVDAVWNRLWAEKGRRVDPRDRWEAELIEAVSQQCHSTAH